MDRHSRQIRLPEVGTSGQGRIARAAIDVRLDGPAADVAARYLSGAGVACVRVRDATLARGARALAPAVRVEEDPRIDVDVDVDVDGGAFDLRDTACRDLMRGARFALGALRAALEGRS
jgi:hypothetical protein